MSAETDSSEPIQCSDCPAVISQVLIRFHDGACPWCGADLDGGDGA